MKPVYTLIVLLLIICSCKKEINNFKQDDLLQTVKKELKDRVSSDDYASLDFSKAVLNKVDSAGLYFFRIPFNGKSIATDFVIIKTLKNGKLVEGKIIQLNGGVVTVGQGPVKNRDWEGSISLSSLNRKEVVNSDIHKGYIQAFHQQISSRESVYGSDVLPEVIVVAYVHPSGIDYSSWIFLNSLFYSNVNDNDVSGGGDSGYYGSMDGGGGSSSGGSYGGTGDAGTGITTDETMLVDVDTYVDHPAINVEQYIKCLMG
jgi:hypothetical protein